MPARTPRTAPWPRGYRAAPAHPTIVNVPDSQAPTPPSSWALDCLNEEFQQIPCPVVLCGTIYYYALSPTSGTDEFGITGYEQGALVSGPTAEAGARYIQAASVDTANQTVVLTGQAEETVTVPWSVFQ